MTDEERRIITEFVQRVAGAAAAQPAAGLSSGPWGGRGGSVPASQPPLPPVDREADALIADLFTRHPEARYRLTQTAFVQEHALTQAQNRIQELEWELEQARRQAQAAQSAPRGGLFGGMFGGGGAPQAPAMPPRPQPLAAPGGYNPAMMQPAAGGGGFLRTAAMTAAGVAGGMVMGNMLMNAFSGGGHAQAAGLGTGGGFGQEAVPTSSPWSDPGAAAAAQGWGSGDPGGGDKAGWGEDKFGNAGQDSWGAQDDAASAGYDDSGDGGGYDEEI